MTLDELLVAFDKWYTFSLDLDAYDLILEKEVDDDINVLDEAMQQRCAILAFVNSRLGKAREWNQKAIGLATEEAVKEGFMGNPLGFISKGRMSKVTGVMERLDRMSATLTHTLEVLRSRMSKAKQEMPTRSYGGR